MRGLLDSCFCAVVYDGATTFAAISSIMLRGVTLSCSYPQWTRRGVLIFPFYRLLSMKSANALLCVPRGDGELPAGHILPALLIGNIPPPSPAGCFHENVRVAKLD